MLVAIDFDVQPDPPLKQREVQLVPLHVKLGEGRQVRHLHGVEQESLRDTVRAKLSRRDGVSLEFLAQLTEIDA